MSTTKPYRSGLYTSFIVEHEMGRGFSARERLTTGPFTTPFEGWDDESLLRQSSSAVSPAILQKLALTPSSKTTITTTTTTTATGSQQQQQQNNNNLKERLSRISTRSSTASLKRRVEPFDEPVCGMKNGQPIVGNSNNSNNFDAFVKERLEQKTRLEEEWRQAPGPEIDPALRLVQQEKDEQEFEWMKVIHKASKETLRKIQQSLVAEEDGFEEDNEEQDEELEEDDDSEYRPQSDDEETNQRRQRMEIIANDLDPSSDGNLLVNFAESVANSVRRTRPMELPMKRAFFKSLKGAKSHTTTTTTTTSTTPDFGEDEVDEYTRGSYSGPEEYDMEFLSSKRIKSKSKSKSKSGSLSHHYGATTTTTTTTTASAQGKHNNKRKSVLEEKKRMLKVEEQLSKIEEKRLRLEKKLQQQEEKRLKDERQRQEIEERIKKDEIHKQRLKERNKKEMEVENEEELFDSSESSDEEDESRRDQGDDASGANLPRSDDGTKSEYSSVSNNKKSSKKKKKKKKQRDDDPGPQFFELGRLGRKGRARKLTPLEIEVHEFLLERYADVRKAFVDQFPHISEEDRLMCPKTKTGVPVVAPEDRVRYPVLNRNGIGGVVSKKPGTQKFQVVFHNVAFSGAKLQLNAKFTSFEDPRDCAAVLAKLDEYFKEFRRSRLPKYLLKKVQERQQNENGTPDPQLLEGNVEDAKSAGGEEGEEARPTATATTTTTTTTIGANLDEQQEDNASTTTEE